MQNQEFDNLRLFAVFSAIPLDIKGSNVSYMGWRPTETDKETYSNCDFYADSVRKGEEKNAKVLFKNVLLKWESCDCGEGHGCSHADWVYEIEIIDNGITYILDYDGLTGDVRNGVKYAAIPMEGSSIYDFYRMCQLVGIRLELSDYAISLLQATSK